MKKRFLILLAVLLIPVAVYAAATLTNDNVEKVGFIANGYSADFSGCETIKAAVAGQSIYIEQVIINSNTAINYTLGAGETTGAVTTVLAGPIYCAANSTTTLIFTRPIKVAAATALTFDASGAGAATVIVQGFIK